MRSWHDGSRHASLNRTDLKAILASNSVRQESFYSKGQKPILKSNNGLLSWYLCLFFNFQAEAMGPYLRKGRRILIEKLDTSKSAKKGKAYLVYLQESIFSSKNDQKSINVKYANWLSIRLSKLDILEFHIYLLTFLLMRRVDQTKPKKKTVHGTITIYKLFFLCCFL